MTRKRPNSMYSIAGSASLLTFMVYLSSLQNDFVGYDDRTYVVGNPFIRSLSPAFFEWAFSDFYAANWHPLTWISHALDYAVWGLNPLGHHLTNNILHAVNTFLVVLVVAKLMEAINLAKNTPPILGGVSEGRGGNWKETLLPDKPPLPLFNQGREPVFGGRGGTFLDERGILITAATTGLLFGLHPIHVESVAWVAERKDLLCALFFLISIMMYMRYARSIFLSFPFVGDPSEIVVNAGKDPGQAGMTVPGTGFLNKHYLLSLTFFLLALMSKPMAVSLPVVLLILDWYPFNRITTMRSFRTAFIEKLPFIAFSLASSVLTMMAQETGGAMELMDYVPLSIRAFVAAKSLLVYLWKMALPINLVPFYPYPRGVSLSSFEYLSIVVLVLGITVACLALARKRQLWLSVWGYYVVTLLPVLGIIQVGHQSMADRYSYLPSLGPFLLIGLTAMWISKRTNFIPKFAGGVVAILAFLYFSYLTYEQTHIWKNGLTLWSYVIDKEPENASAYYHRGVMLEEVGQFDKATADYDMAIGLNPLHYGAHNNLGVLYGKNGRLDKAIESFSRSISINPNNPDAYCNRGYTYSLSGQNSEALKDFKRAIELDRNNPKAYFNRGNLYLSAGSKMLAVSDFRKACSLGDEVGCYSAKLYGP